jgi:hypothetical protein
MEMQDEDAEELVTVLAMTQNELDEAHEIFMITVAQTDMLAEAQTDMLAEAQEPFADPSDMPFIASIQANALALAEPEPIAVQESSPNKSTVMCDRQEVNPQQLPHKKTPAQKKLDKQMKEKAAADKAQRTAIMLANRQANVLARRRARKGLTPRTSLTPWWKRLSTVEESKIFNGYLDGVEGVPQWKFDTAMELRAYRRAQGHKLKQDRTMPDIWRKKRENKGHLVSVPQNTQKATEKAASMFVMGIIDKDAESGRIRMRAKSQVVQDWESRRTLFRRWAVIMRKRRSARVRTLKRARDGLRGSSEEPVTGYHRLAPQSRLNDHSTHLTLKWARFARTLTRLSVIKKFTHDPIDVGFLVGEVGGGSVFVSDVSPASNGSDEGSVSVVVSSASGHSANNFDGTSVSRSCATAPQDFRPRIGAHQPQDFPRLFQNEPQYNTSASGHLHDFDNSTIIAYSNCNPPIFMSTSNKEYFTPGNGANKESATQWIDTIGRTAANCAQNFFTVLGAERIEGKRHPEIAMKRCLCPGIPDPPIRLASATTHRNGINCVSINCGALLAVTGDLELMCCIGANHGMMAMCRSDESSREGGSKLSEATDLKQFTHIHCFSTNFGALLALAGDLELVCCIAVTHGMMAMCKIEGRSREGRSKLSKVTDQKVSVAASGSLAPSSRPAWEEDDGVVQARLATMKLGTAPPCDLPARYCRCRSRVTQVMRRALKKKGEKRGTSSYKPPLFFLFSDFSWWQWRGDECADPARSPTALQPHAFLTVPRPRPHCSDPARSPTALQPHALLTVPRPITVKGKLEKLQTPVFKKKKRYHEWRALVDSPDGVLNRGSPQ